MGASWAAPMFRSNSMKARCLRSSVSPALASRRFCSCSQNHLEADAGRVLYRMRDNVTRDLMELGEAERRFLFRTDWGFVHQDAAQGLRMGVSAGANVGERLMAVGQRHYGNIRTSAAQWLERVEINTGRIDDAPRTFLRWHAPAFADRAQSRHPPAAGSSWTNRPAALTYRVQARLLDLLSRLVHDLGAGRCHRHA